MRPAPTFYVAILLLAAATPAANAQWEPDQSDKRQVAAAKAIERIRDQVERSAVFFDDAYAMAIFPSITRVGFGFGGAYGRGIVLEGDELIGRTSYSQFTSGIQAGAKNFSMIVFFKDEAALNEYRESRTQFLGQAGVSVATVGAEGTPAYNDGVTIITATKFGLMGEFTISGAKFRFIPKSKAEE